MRGIFRLIVVLVAAAVLYVLADHLWPQPMAKFALGAQRTLAGMQVRQISVDGIDYRYLDNGGSGETTVLLHGFGADKDHFTLSAIFLRGSGRVIAVDLPGFGDSAKPADADYTVAAQVQRLQGLLGALKLARVHLGGSSMGGAVALEYARAHPERVASLWLLAPAGVASARQTELIQRFQADHESLLVARTPEQFKGMIELAMHKPPPMPYSLLHELARAAVANAPLHARIFARMIETMPALEQTAAGLKTPTLIVWGEQDRILDVSGASILHQALPHSHLIIMPGVGHLPMLEAPYRTARDYKRFRAGLPPPG